MKRLATILDLALSGVANPSNVGTAFCRLLTIASTIFLKPAISIAIG